MFKEIKKICTRTEDNLFNFKQQCFYCEKICTIDKKHPDRDPFEEVGTKDTAIHKFTLKTQSQ